MRRKIVLAKIILALAASVAVFVTMKIHGDQASAQSKLDARGDEWETKLVIEDYPVTYRDGDGNTIIYHVCKTIYNDDAIPAVISSVNTKAYSHIFNVEQAESSSSLQVNDMDAVLYIVSERAYLCWTASPEYSFVLEYDPVKVEQAEILKMAESVPNTDG